MVRTAMTSASRSRLAAVLVTLLTGGLVLTGSASGDARHVDGTTDAQSTPQFGHPRANPYFPITPGLVTRLRGTDDGARFREVVAVTDRTKVITGIRATMIRDVLRRWDGSVAEKTRDWYADDDDGNVWYLGERTATYDRDGHLVSREGSWLAGVRGARMGTIMPAHPTVTDAYRQEHLTGHAEDQAWIVQRGMTVTVPAGTYARTLRSLEWSRLEPRNVSAKFYAPGIGIVTERDMAGGSERFWLVSVTRP